MLQLNLDLISVVLFRAIQTALEASPTFLCGLLVAGLIRGILGPNLVQSCFTLDPRIGPLRAWITGFVVPVCSFGILPVAWELKRAGVPRFTVLTFLISAPVLNPFSFVYAFEKLEARGISGIIPIVLMAVASFALVAGPATLLGIWLPGQKTESPSTPLPRSGISRVAIVFLSAGRALNSVLMIYIAIGLAGAGFLAVVRGGAIERAVTNPSTFSSIYLGMLAIPCQVSPAHGIEILCESLFSGIPSGHLVVFYLLGIGVNIGTLSWMISTYGIRTTTLFVLLVFGGVIGTGQLLNSSLTNGAKVESSMVHYLEIEAGGGAAVAKARALRTTVLNDNGEWQFYVIGALGGLLLLWAIGFASTFFGDRGSVSHFIRQHSAAPTTDDTGLMNLALSHQIYGLIGIVIVLAGTAPALYIYYPPSAELLGEMETVERDLSTAIKANPFSRRNTLRTVTHWKRLQSKIAVSEFIRHGWISREKRELAKEMRARLERLRMGITEASSDQELQEGLDQLRQSLMAYRESLNATLNPQLTNPK